MKDGEPDSKCRSPQELGASGGGRELSWQTRLLAWGAIVALILLNGCSTRRAQADLDTWRYNPTTGYPAVGGAG